MAKSRGYTRRRPSSDARAKAWVSMRILQHFTLPQLQMTSGISEGNLFVFLRRLVQAGYLWVVKEREINRPGSRTVYRLVRNTGPLHPIPQRTGEIYDPNVQQVFGQSKDGPTQNAIIRKAALESEHGLHTCINMSARKSSRVRTLESEARRAAKRIGLVANKARGRRGDNNLGGFALINPVEGRIVVGKKFDLTAEDVIEHCRSVGDRRQGVKIETMEELKLIAYYRLSSPEEQHHIRQLAIRLRNRRPDQGTGPITSGSNFNKGHGLA